MRADGVSELWLALERTAVATAVREGTWLYPAIQSAHVLGLATLFGSLAVLDLRLLGVSRALPVAPLARHALRAVHAAFIVLVVSGSLLFVADASALVSNPAFRAKMIVVPVAALNGLAFELRHLRRADRLGLEDAPPGGRPAAALSLVLWTLVIVLGRLIAYV